MIPQHDYMSTYLIDTWKLISVVHGHVDDGRRDNCEDLHDRPIEQLSGEGIRICDTM